MNKNIIIYLLGIGLTIFFFVFLLSTNLINYSVREKCQDAQRKYNGDCVEALTSFLDDESNGFRARNSAIWALGQINDKRALPILENYYTGDIPKRESLNKSLSQYELQKAISYMNGSPNITKFFWCLGRGSN